ncbi:cell division protein FtsL [Enterococcus florum]|uniref:Cell division protein FtsL n=1 Tax=Enterococcus florum TaxID=2480627 RepID=A0A4P5PCG3_9ENTE|nr:cell division protein FtsL [Enterococcus florum]GCF93971.1 cell division protein FtsL [Enterococcus florum]
MAELKNDQQRPFDYARPEQTTQMPDSFDVFVSPAERLKKVSRIEKIAVVGLLLMLIATAVLMVNMRNDVSKTQNEISNIQSQIDEKEKTATQLQQEKNELSRSDRLKEIAEKAELKINDENLRKVK